MQSAANARSAVELAQARLAGKGLVSSDESDERKRASVVHELSGVDLSLSFEDVESLMNRRLVEARGLAMESVVAWEIEEELSAMTKTSVDAVSRLERRLDEVESWLSSHETELGELKAGLDALLRENKAVEMQRVNMGKLDAALKETVGALSLPAGTEDALLNPGGLLRRRESLGPTVDAYQAAIERAGELKTSRVAVQERQDQLRALGDALCSGAEKHGRSMIDRASRKYAEHNSRQQLESMSAGALRSTLRRRQREFHATLESEAGEAVAALRSLASSNGESSLRRLSVATASTTRDLVYGPLLRAYVHALLAEDTKSASWTLARALDELRPLVVEERKAFREFYGNDETKTQFRELRELLTNLVESRGGGSVEAAALIGVVEDAAAATATDDAWWSETHSALKRAAIGKWRDFVEERCKWIRSSEISRKREHGSGPSSASVEIVSLSERLERVVSDVPRRQETRQRLSAQVARPAYDKLALAFDDWLSKAVAADSKYGVLVELENGDYVASRSPPALASRIFRGKSNDDAIRRYSDWMWSYEFAKVDAFFDRVQRREKAVGGNSPFSSSSSVPSLATIDDNLNKIFKRLDKHFPDASRADPAIRPKLRNSLVEAFKAKWARYDSIHRTHLHAALVPTLPQFETLIAKNER